MSVDLIESIRFREIERPLKVPFATSLGSKTAARSIVVRVILTSGAVGFGECPTSSAFGTETIPAIKKMLAEWTPVMKGMPINYWDAEIASLRRRYPNCPMTVSGLEAALFRADLKRRGISEHSYWGGASHEIKTDITVPFIPGHAVLEQWIDESVKLGFRIFKIKVSGDVEVDTEFVAHLCAIIRHRTDDYALRLDGNQGYTAATFRRMTDLLEKSRAPVELFEQPLRRDDFAGFKEIRESSPYPIILDETVVHSDDLQMAISEDLCHGVNIKTAKSGILESAAILKLAKANGLKTMIGCMTETMIGLSAAVYFAAGTGGFDYVDLDGALFLCHCDRYGAIEISPPGFFVVEPFSDPA